MTTTKEKEEQGEFNEEQKEFISKHVRQLAQSKLEGKAAPNRDSEAREKGLFKKCGGVFVTFENHGELRGCIGIFVPDDPLFKVIESRTLASLKDGRFSFNPITAQEFKNEIEITISVLSAPIPVSDPMKEIVVGVHGIIVSKGSMFRGTYLPQVATEQGWDLKTFLVHCAVHKAGIPSKDPLNDPSIKWESYTATLIRENRH